ncbi:MAG: phosphatase domain-containing protein [Pirellulaceae bacterium]
MSSDIEIVVDLTCEFSEPRTIRSARRYIAFPMLDAATLPSRSLAEFVCCLAVEDGRMFIHCAQGHGRTGLITALLLVAKGDVQNADDALLKVQASRPFVRLNAAQLAGLRSAAELLIAGK